MKYFGFNTLFLICFVINSVSVSNSDECYDAFYMQLESDISSKLHYEQVEQKCKDRGLQLPRLTWDEGYKFLVEKLFPGNRAYPSAKRKPNGERFEPGHIRNKYLGKFNIKGNQTFEFECLIASSDRGKEGIDLIAQPFTSFETVRCLKTIPKPSNSSPSLWFTAAIVITVFSWLFCYICYTCCISMIGERYSVVDIEESPPSQGHST